jgi:N-acetylglucosamine-6-phosphate deacetylase
MNTKSLLIKNCRLYSSDNICHIIIKKKQISEIRTSKLPNFSGEVLDANFRIVTPGLIDLHIQGAGGADILDGTREAVHTISSALGRLGTTSFLGTTVLKSKEKNKHIKNANEYVNKDLPGAILLGFHLEGPFVNPNKKGGLASDGIYPASENALFEIFDICEDNLRMMTIAPEIPNAIEIIRELVKRGVVASFGHSDASYEETILGLKAGISHCTHIFNAMSSINHRDPGPLPAIFENDRITAQIISDGNHLHPVIVRMLFKILGPRRCVCITDGIRAIGLPDGVYSYNGRECESKLGAARYLDGTLIGTTMSLAEIAMKFKEFTNCNFKEAIDTVTMNPAITLGIDKQKGTIAVGKDADIVIFENDFSIFATVIGGRIVYQK